MTDTPTPPRLVLTARDAAICLAAHEHRLLDARILGWLFFPSAAGGAVDERAGPSSAVHRRASLLADHGYLRRVYRPVLPGAGQAPLAYALGARGVALVAGRYGLDPAALAIPKRDATSPLFVDHTLGTTRAYAALAAGCARTPDVRLEDWVGEGTLRRASTRSAVQGRSEGHQRDVPPIPDGTGRLVHDDGTGRLFTARIFCELDRGTETNARVAAKFSADAAYMRSARYAATYGESIALILWVVTGPKRLANTLRTIAAVARDEPTLRSRVLGAVLADLTPGATLGPVWTVADTGERRPLLRRER